MPRAELVAIAPMLPGGRPAVVVRRKRLRPGQRGCGGPLGSSAGSSRKWVRRANAAAGPPAYAQCAPIAADMPAPLESQSQVGLAIMTTAAGKRMRLIYRGCVFYAGAVGWSLLTCCNGRARACWQA